MLIIVLAALFFAGAVALATLEYTAHKNRAAQLHSRAIWASQRRRL